jgi:hypothetical protein
MFLDSLDSYKRNGYFEYKIYGYQILAIEIFSFIEAKLLKDGSLVEKTAFFDFCTVASVYRHQKAFYFLFVAFPL